MHRVDTSTASVSLPAPRPPGTPGYFTEGDPAVPVPATYPGADYFNMLQEELIGILVAAGITPDQTKNNFNQVVAAILQLIDDGAQAKIDALVAAAPGALDTLNELAAALGDDPNFAATMTAALAGKAATSHTHAIANVTGLQSALDGKAATSHTHAIANITGLQSALDGKQNNNNVITDYESGLWYTFDSNDKVSDASLPTGAIGSSFTSIGPTGSGASVIWPQLDNLPPNVTHIRIKYYVSFLTSSATSNGVFYFYVRDYGSSDTGHIRSISLHSPKIANDEATATSELTIKLGSNKRFEASKVTTNLFSLTFEMKLIEYKA